MDLSTAISRKQCKIGGKLVLITNRKSYMSFRWYQNRWHCLLWPYGWMDQDTTCYRDRPRPMQHYVRIGTRLPPPCKGAKHSPHFSAHVNCGQMVAHLSNCWALVNTGNGLYACAAQTAAVSRRDRWVDIDSHRSTSYVAAMRIADADIIFLCPVVSIFLSSFYFVFLA